MQFAVLFVAIFISEVIANGSYRYPLGCDTPSCVYTATWQHYPNLKNVVFTISAKVQTGQWAGIGFSKDMQLDNTDVYIGYYMKNTNRFMFSDRYIQVKSTGQILEDATQNGFILDKNYSGNTMSFSFDRYIDTQDPNDVYLGECVYFQYAWGGGVKADGTIESHNMAEWSQQKICVTGNMKPMPTVPPYQPTMYSMQTEAPGTAAYNPEASYSSYQDPESPKYYRSEAPYNPAATPVYQPPQTNVYNPPASVYNKPPTPMYMPPTPATAAYNSVASYSSYQDPESPRYYRSEAPYNPAATPVYQPPQTNVYNPPASVYNKPPTPMYMPPSPVPSNPPIVVYNPPVADLGYETGNSFRYPRSCKIGVSCVYEAEWESDPYSNFVWFRISAKVGQGIWAGIGFSEDKKMLYSDATTGFLSSPSNFVLQDRYLSSYDASGVTLDAKQNLELVSHAHNNGMLSFMFKKPRDTGDKFDRSLSECNYILFAWGGRASGSFISKHTERFISQEKVCLGDKHGYTGPKNAPKYEFVNRRTESHEEQCKKLYCQVNEVCQKSGILSFCQCKPGYSKTAIGCRPVVLTAISGPPTYTLNQQNPPIRNLARGYGTETTSSFRYPGNCIIDIDCEYIAEWENYPLSDYLWFTITARVGVGYWAGIGFSNDKYMVGSDAVTGHMSYNNALMIYDRFLTSKSPQGVRVDANQNIEVVTQSHNNGVLKFMFKRLRDTRDYAEDIALSECKYLLFAWGGRADGFTLSKHTHKFVTENQRCLGPKHGYTGPGSSFAEAPRYKFLRRPLENHYDPCRRIECKKDSLCIREGEKAICRCPIGYEDLPQGCFKF